MSYLLGYPVAEGFSRPPITKPYEGSESIGWFVTLRCSLPAIISNSQENLKEERQ